MLDYEGFGLDRTCPSPNTYSVSTMGSFTIDLSPFCSLAEIISVFVMFTASVISLRIIAR
jgi:hypothetical protein